MHDSLTLDPGTDLTSVTEQHCLLDRLEQLAHVHDRIGGFADDHVLTMLVDRYRESSSLRDSA